MASTTERAADIRKTLKAKHGWSSRDISVKADYYSMGSAIRVSIKNPAVPFDAVKAIAEDHESISRDGYGEILSGGNRYVTISYTSAALDILGQRFTAAVQAAVDATEEDSSCLTPVANTPFMIGRKPGRISLWNHTSHMHDAYSVQEIAQSIAINLLNEGQCA